MPIPWNDQAVVSTDKDGGMRKELAAGTLDQVVQWLSQLKPIEWQNYLIAMPDRNSPPYRFTSDAILDLVTQRRLIRIRIATEA